MKKSIVSIIVLALLVTCILPATAFAAVEGGQYGGLVWSFNTDTGALEIFGSGAMPDATADAPAPWASLLDQVRSVAIDSRVTSIGANAFAGANLLTEITLPKAIESVGSDAFKDSGIAAVKLPCSVPADKLAAMKSACGKTEGITWTVLHDTAALTHVSRKEASYTEDGNIEYWKCSCGAFFRDASCTQPITEAETVIPRLADVEPPVLTSVFLDKYTVSLPAAVTVTVDAADNLSGVRDGSIIFSSFTNPNAPKLGSALSLVGGKLIGTVALTDTTIPSGKYYITSLTLSDNAGNTRNYSYSTLDSAFKEVGISVVRASTVNTIPTLTLNATSVGYGGVVTGTVLLKDVNGNPLAAQSLDIYAGTLKATTVTTDASGSATFNYSNTVPGTYTLKAAYLGSADYNPSESNTASITFTNVPATGDSYNVALWACVAVLAIGVNAWFILRRKKA